MCSDRKSALVMSFPWRKSGHFESPEWVLERVER